MFRQGAEARFKAIGARHHDKDSIMIFIIDFYLFIILHFVFSCFSLLFLSHIDLLRSLNLLDTV